MTQTEINTLIKNTQALEKEYGGIEVSLAGMTTQQIQNYHSFLEHKNNL